ncbi:MAG: 3-hydroxyacyl-CoA dehydrogenase family protein [Opitutaceae bacterium]|jgi:3-hydroxybutyryl-CoA dehydrogenase
MIHKNVGVIGAGVMGAGVAQNLAQRGIQAVLVDISNEALNKARESIYNAARMALMFRRDDAAAPDPDQIVSMIEFTTDYQRLSGVDFVVENVVEKLQVKSAIYPKLDAICPPDCIFAANTSAISITKLGGLTQRADRVLGMHFMNPVPMKTMVEVIRGHHTSEETLTRGKAFLAQLGKEAVVVNDMPGFVSNRVLMLTVNEAVWLVQDQVASAADVDKIFRSCFGHKMGPLETGDLIGLDTILYSLDELYAAYGDPKFRRCPLLQKMVDAGLHGRKSGEGFYKYSI